MRAGLLIGTFILLGWTATSVAAQSISAPNIPQSEKEQAASFYTLQINQEGDLAALEKAADYFTQLVPLRTRIVKQGEIYVIRIGKSSQSDELEAHISALKSNGFWNAAILYMPTDNEAVAKVINPEQPESANQPLHQPYLLQARQDETPTVARRMGEIFPNEIEISRLSRLKREMDEKPPEESGALIQRAWETYRHGSLTSACELFESAQTLPGVEQEALRGLAHCFLQMGNYEEAVALLTWFIQKGVKPEETRTLLVEALFKAGQFDSAQKEAHLLEEAQARQWRALICRTQQDIELVRVQKGYDPKNPETFVEKYRVYMEQCLLPDTFLTAAKDLMTAKNAAAAQLFEQLLDACGGRWDVKLSAYIGLMQILPPEIIRPRIDRELERLNLPSDYRVKLLAEADKLEPDTPKNAGTVNRPKNGTKQPPAKAEGFK